MTAKSPSKDAITPLVGKSDLHLWKVICVITPSDGEWSNIQFHLWLINDVITPLKNKCTITRCNGKMCDCTFKWK